MCMKYSRVCYMSMQADDDADLLVEVSPSWVERLHVSLAGRPAYRPSESYTVSVSCDFSTSFVTDSLSIMSVHSVRWHLGCKMASWILYTFRTFTFCQRCLVTGAGFVSFAT